MNYSRNIFISIIANIILIILCLFFIYVWLDNSITIDHTWQALDSKTRDNEILKVLLQEAGKNINKKKFKIYIETNFSDENKYVIKEGRDSITVDNIILEFKGEKLIKIEFYDQ